LHAGALSAHKLLLTSIRTGDTEIFIVDPDTGDAFNVSRSPQSEVVIPCWSPDGRYIAFSSTRTGSSKIFVMNANGFNQRALTPSKGGESSPAWSRRFE
jgi:TolB protein